MRRFTSPTAKLADCTHHAPRDESHHAERDEYSNSHRSAGDAKHRRGTVALEFLWLAPVLLGLLLAFVEYTAIVSCEEKLCRASHAGCTAACHGASLHQIHEIVDRNLGCGPLGHHREIKVCRVVHTHHGVHLEPVHHPEHLPCGTEIVVNVECEAEKVIPNLLGRIGFRLCGEVLTGETTQCKD